MATNILGCVRSILSAVPWMAVCLMANGYSDIVIVFTINVMKKWKGNDRILSKFKILAGIPQTRYSYRKEYGCWMYQCQESDVYNVVSPGMLVKLLLGTASQHVIHFCVYHTFACRIVMSVFPYIIILEPRNELPWNLILENLTKPPRHIPILGKTEKQ